MVKSCVPWNRMGIKRLPPVPFYSQVSITLPATRSSAQPKAHKRQFEEGLLEDERRRVPEHPEEVDQNGG